MALTDLPIASKETMSATQKDVAARAGVSSIVVSHVLHNKASSVRVSDSTAERVRQAARDLDYRLNVAARNFRSQQSHAIGVLHGLAYPSIRFDDRGGYMSSLTQGLIEGAFKHDYSLTMCPKLVGNDPLEAMCDGRFDGLVWYSTTQTLTYYQVIESCTVPLVVIHASAKDVKNHRSTVICDNRQGMRLAVEHLLDLGHKRFLYVLGDTHNPEAFARLDALRSVLEERGLSLADEDVLNLSNGSEAAAEYLSRPRHTAVLAYSDRLAAVFLTASVEAGFDIPGDFSLIGFDSTHYCNEFRPRITSVRQPIAELGKIAIDMLVEQLRDKSLPPRHQIIPCSLDVRESTGPCRSA